MITVTELLYAVQLIYSVNFKTIPLLIVASLWYLIVTSVLTVGQYYIERYYARGSARELPPTPLQRIRRRLFTFHDAMAALPAADAARGATVSARADGEPPVQGTGGTPMVLAESVHKYFGRLEVLRGIDLEVARRRGHVHRRALRLGQVHVPALHQPPGKDRRRPAFGRRRAGRLPAERRQALRAARQGSLLASARKSAWSSSGSTCSRI